MSMEHTLGQKRVRSAFNPSTENVVDVIKEKTAELIDICNEMREKDPRLCALAQTTYEEAAMWAVKCATAAR